MTEDPHLARLLARRTKEPSPPPSVTSPVDSLNLSFGTCLDDEETKEKIAFLSYNAESLEEKNSELSEENQRLRGLLRTRENDLFKLKNDMDELKVATGGGGLGSDKAIQRIVELSKKNRDLVSQLEKERDNAKKLSSKINNFNSNQEVQRKLKSAVQAKKQRDTETASSRGTPSAEDKEKQMRERLATMTKNLTETSHQADAMKQENKLLTKLLQREVGEGTTVQSILAAPNSWRGRAEQISVLQSKLHAIKTEESGPVNRMEKQRQRDIKTLENNRKQQLQELKKEVEQLKGEVATSKKNYDAVKARNSTLSGEIKSLRSQFAALVDKGRNDDALINQLLEQREAAAESGQTETPSREAELIAEVERLKNYLDQRTQRVTQLEEEITRNREISMRARPGSQPRSAPEIGHGGNGQPAGFDVRYLLKATEVEKERLFELTEMLNNRINTLENDMTEKDMCMLRSNRQVVELEKIVENLRSKKLPRCDGCNQKATINYPPDESRYHCVTQHIGWNIGWDDLLLQVHNLSHLDAVGEDRKSDLQKYKGLLEQSRGVFLAALKQYQAERVEMLIFFLNFVFRLEKRCLIPVRVTQNAERGASSVRQYFEMPVVQVTTNLTRKLGLELAKGITVLVSEMNQKPAEGVVVTHKNELEMYYDGSDDPLAHVRCDGCNQKATINYPPDESRIDILEDEVQVLKSHLDAVGEDRKSDLQKYKGLLEQSRGVFLAALKQYQAERVEMLIFFLNFVFRLEKRCLIPVRVTQNAERGASSVRQSFEMPVVQVTTNLTRKLGLELAKGITVLVSEMNQKPAEGVVVTHKNELEMYYVGSDDPLAHVRFTSIGMTGNDTEKYSKGFSTFFKKNLGISEDRVVIEFHAAEATFMGKSVFRMSGRRESPKGDDTVIRIPPHFYIHVLDLKTNVTKTTIGPDTFVRQDNEKVVEGPTRMIIIPPNHYCVVANPVMRDDKGGAKFDNYGQVQLNHADLEVRLHQQPFPLYPGESMDVKVTKLRAVTTNTALRLRAITDFTDAEGVQRFAHDEWLFAGPVAFEMPVVQVTTNLTRKLGLELAKGITVLVSEMTHKPAEGVVVTHKNELEMYYVGSDDPLAHVRFTSIGMTGNDTEKYSKGFSTFFKKNLGISENRVVIEFHAAEATFMGKSVFRMSGRRESPKGDDTVIRIPPHFYIHVLDLKTNVTKTTIGPDTFVRQDNEKVVEGPTRMIIIPPNHYCVVANPVMRDDKGGAKFDNYGQVQLNHADLEVRLHQQPFPLYPGESMDVKVTKLRAVTTNTALRLRAITDFTDAEGVQRFAHDEWLFAGPGTYIPHKNVEIVETIRASIIKPNEALRLRALKACKDQVGKDRVCGEEWLIFETGAYLPGAYEQVVGTISAYILTDNIALHLEALQSFKDRFGVERKSGEQWLITLKESEAFIPDVYENVLAPINISTLTNRQYCIILDPLGEDGKNKLGQRKLVKKYAHDLELYVLSCSRNCRVPISNPILLRSFAAKSRAPPFLRIVIAPSFQLQSKNDPQVFERSRRDLQKTWGDFVGKDRVCGEEWLIFETGAYLPGAYEQVVGTISAYILTDNIALHLEALQSFKDRFGIERKSGEQWLITLKESEAFIPDVYENVLAPINISTLTNRQYCIILDPLGEDGKNKLGQRKLVKGEKSFFLQPGERLESGIQDVYILLEDEALIVKAVLAHTDSEGKVRQPGNMWMIRGPAEFIPSVDIEIVERRKAFPLDENEGIYVRDIKSGKVRAIVGQTYILNQDEELWNKELPDQIEKLLSAEIDPLADRTARAHNKDNKGRVKHKVITYRVPHNAAAQIYDYKAKQARVAFGPDLIMLAPDLVKWVERDRPPFGFAGFVIRSLCLLLGPDFMTDIITVETSDHARLSLQLSYNWHFEVADEKDTAASAALFAVPDFVGDACKALASRIRGAVAAVPFDDFHRNSARIIRTSVFGLDENMKVGVCPSIGQSWRRSRDKTLPARYRPNQEILVPDWLITNQIVSGSTQTDLLSQTWISNRWNLWIRGPGIPYRNLSSWLLRLPLTHRRHLLGTKLSDWSRVPEVDWNDRRLTPHFPLRHEAERLEQGARSTKLSDWSRVPEVDWNDRILTPHFPLRHEAERLEQGARGRLERQKINDEAEAEKARTELLKLQANSAAVESTGQAKAEAQSRAESSKIEGALCGQQLYRPNQEILVPDWLITNQIVSGSTQTDLLSQTWISNRWSLWIRGPGIPYRNLSSWLLRLPLTHRRHLLGTKLSDWSRVPEVDWKDRRLTPHFPLRHEAERLEQGARGRLERQKINDEAEAEKARTELLKLQANSAAVESTGQAKAEAQSRAESSKIEGEAAVDQAKLKAEANNIEAEAELSRINNARQGELTYVAANNSLEIERAKQMAAIETSKFENMVTTLGSENIARIATSGHDNQLAMLKALGLQSTLITDGSTPLNLFNTAKGFIGQLEDGAGTSH
eukprot:sb/3460471/